MRRRFAVAVAAVVLGLATGGGGCRYGGEPFTPSKHVKQLASAADFEQRVREGVALVDFYADWCGPCRHLKPTVHGLADDYAGRVAVVTVDVDQLPELAREHGVSSIPDVRVFKDGRQVEQLIGLRPRSRYAELLDSLLGAEESQTP